VAEAKKLIAGYLKAPTGTVPGLAPLTTKPPSGKTVLYLDNGTLPSIAVGDGVEAAAKALGWKFEHLSAGATPPDISKAWSEAVQLAPSVVMGCGNPNVLFSAQLAQLKAKGIPYVGCAVDETPKGDEIATVLNAAQYVAWGKWQARWIVAHSNGHADTAEIHLLAVPILNVLISSFGAEYKRLCPSCKLRVIDVTGAQIGTAVPSIVVSAVQRDPTLNWLSLDVGDLSLGVPQALAAAGLSHRVTWVSNAGSQRNFADIISGVESAELPFASHEIGDLMVDAYIRHIEGLPIPESDYGSFPGQFFDKQNTPRPPVAYTGPPGVLAQFLKLWKVVK